MKRRKKKRKKTVLTRRYPKSLTMAAAAVETGRMGPGVTPPRRMKRTRAKNGNAPNFKRNSGSFHALLRFNYREQTNEESV